MLYRGCCLVHRTCFIFIISPVLYSYIGVFLSFFCDYIITRELHKSNRKVVRSTHKKTVQYAEISPFGQYVFTEPENLWYNIIVAGLLIFIGSALSVKHLLYRPVQILYITYPRREERLEFMVIYPITEKLFAKERPQKKR